MQNAEHPRSRQTGRKLQQYLIYFIKEIASEEGIFQKNRLGRAISNTTYLRMLTNKPTSMLQFIMSLYESMSVAVATSTISLNLQMTDDASSIDKLVFGDPIWIRVSKNRNIRMTANASIIEDLVS